MQLKCQTINPIQILVGFNYTQYSSITAICSHTHVTVLSFRSSKYWACYYHFNNVCWTIQWFFLYDEILFRYMIDFTLEAALEENHLATLSPIADDIGLVIATCNFARRAKNVLMIGNKLWQKTFSLLKQINSHPFKVTIYQGKPDAILWVYGYISCVERCLFSLILANACNKSRLY